MEVAPIKIKDKFINSRGLSPLKTMTDEFGPTVKQDRETPAAKLYDAKRKHYLLQNVKMEKVVDLIFKQQQETFNSEKRQKRTKSPQF